MKVFCIAGPVNPEDHYCLPPAIRLNEQELQMLITQKKYFILHAPRQTGKTSTMINFANQLNKEGTYSALYINIEGAQAMRGKIKEALAIVLDRFKGEIPRQLGKTNEGMRFFEEGHSQNVVPGNELASFLQFWSQHNSKPLVIFIDEIDTLVGDTLISVLRQLRAGYANRPQSFPQSVCMIGVRDVRDYRIWSDAEQKTILGGSAFNIKSESIRMADFTHEQVKELYLQHTQATGQKFETQAIDYAFEITQGQPWLVNALAYEACFRNNTDRTKPITKEILETAKETLIKRRDTHLDVLIDRLQEQRIYNIIDAIITGNIKTAAELKQDDILYARDLGLIKLKGLEIANPIYQEVIPRELTYAKQEEMIQDIKWYQDADGTLNMTKLLEAFTEFYRENATDWLADCKYKESGPHLLLMAFLQRVINGGGKIHREYALGRKRLDLLLTWKKQKIAIELKVYKDSKTLPDGLEQTIGYMDISGAKEGHLVIFDKRDKCWEEKIYTKQEHVGNKIITVWGM